LKYQSLPAFEKHLDQAAKIQLSRVFLVVSPCSYERKKIVGKIIAAIQSREGEIDLQVHEGAQEAAEEVVNGLNTISILMGKQVVYLDGVDKFKKNGLALLANYAARPSPFSYLLLGAASGKSLVDLYAKGKKDLIACDLSDEKPWDRKDRFKRMLMDYAAKVGKRLSGDALEHLLENVGLNLPGLEQEVEKLITYAGERCELTLEDVHSLCSAQKSATLWQLAEAIAWKEPFPKLDIDLNLLFPLFSQLRTQFQHGLTLSILLERGTPYADIASYVPSLKPGTLDKMLPSAKARRSSFFKCALDLLFDVELMAKNSSLDPALILDLLLTKLTLLKRHYALPVPQSSR
jgi:DNA polymerase-3 subunit delta